MLRLRNRISGVVVNVRDSKTLGAEWGPADAGPQAPPKAGRGSSRQAWSDYASTVGVDVTDDMSRNDIAEAVEG